jgi:hypothetical protein
MTIVPQKDDGRAHEFLKTSTHARSIGVLGTKMHTNWNDIVHPLV